MSNKLYEVYLCKYKDEVVYVGQGGYKRHKHCNSGISHVYETASLHRLGSVVKNLRFGKVTGGMSDIFKETLENTYSECFGKLVNIAWTMDKKIDEI